MTVLFSGQFFISPLFYAFLRVQQSQSLQGRQVSQTAAGSLSVGIDAPSLARGIDRAPSTYSKNECGT